MLDDVWNEVGKTGALTVDNRMAVRQASTFAIHTARDVVHSVYHEAGSTAIFDNQPFERRLRDINSVSQQLQGRRTCILRRLASISSAVSRNLRWA